MKNFDIRDLPCNHDYASRLVTVFDLISHTSRTYTVAFLDVNRCPERGPNIYASSIIVKVGLFGRRDAQ